MSQVCRTVSRAAEPASEITILNDIAADTTWYNTNVYYLNGYIHVLAPATLTIQPGTIRRGLSLPVACLDSGTQPLASTEPH